MIKQLTGVHVKCFVFVNVYQVVWHKTTSKCSFKGIVFLLEFDRQTCNFFILKWVNLDSSSLRHIIAKSKQTNQFEYIFCIYFSDDLMKQINDEHVFMTLIVFYLHFPPK